MCVCVCVYQFIPLQVKRKEEKLNVLETTLYALRDALSSTRTPKLCQDPEIQAADQAS